MKRFSAFLIIFIWFCAHMYSQNLGLNTTTPDPSALVDMGEIPKGLLVPRMTQAERVAISNPLNALIVFQTDYPSGFYYYDLLSLGWKQMTGSNNRLRDTDNDTQILTEATPDEDIIRIRIRETEKLVLQKNIAAAYGRVEIVNNQGNILFGDSTMTNGGIDARDNVAIQFSALKNNMAGKDNIAIGTSALSDYASNNAIGIGFESLKNALPFDYHNIALGYRSNINGGGDNSVVIGSEASPKSSYSSSISIGQASGFENVSGFKNIMIGAESMYQISSGYNNVAIGYRSMYHNNVNHRNIMIGSESGYKGTDNTGIGYKTLSAIYAEQNLGVGSQALSLHYTGNNNYALGFSAMKNNTTGRNNIAMGSFSLEGNTSGGHNIAVGHRSLFADAGKYNIGIGSQAFSAVGGNTARNVVIGANTQTNEVPGNDNVIVGYNASVGPGVHDAVVIGSHAYADSSNTVILGSVAGINGATETIRVGLGTSTPHSSSIFEMKSSHKPFYIPYGIPGAHPNPAEGLMFNYGASTYFYNGSEWTEINGLNLYESEGATTGQTFVVRNQSVVKGYPNAIKDGETIFSKATIEENENDNKFRLRLHGETVLVLGENTNGQLLMETLANNKNILSGTNDVGGASTENTILCKFNNSIYYDGNTIAGDYVLFGAEGVNFTGLGLNTFANWSGPAQNNDESVGIGIEAGSDMTGEGYAIAGNRVTEQSSTIINRNDILVIGHNSSVLSAHENASVIGHNAELRCSHCVVLGNEKTFPVTSDKEQDTGIGTTAPQSALHIYGPGTIDHPNLRLEKTNSDPAIITFRNPTNNVENFLTAETAANNSNAVFKLGTTSNGMMFRLFGNGNANIVSLAQSSDSTLKKNLTPLKGSLKRLSGIKPIHYTWKDIQKENTLQTGFSAQEVEQTFPELTGINNEGFKTVNYHSLNAVLWQSLQELVEKSENQISEIEKQEAKIQELTDRLEKLKIKQNLASYEKEK